MSKDKPEVGDVWISPKGIKVYITEIRNHVYVVTENGIPSSRWWGEFTVQKSYKYLGKSKANIDDLFKTENEE